MKNAYDKITSLCLLVLLGTHILVAGPIPTATYAATIRGEAFIFRYPRDLPDISAPVSGFVVTDSGVLRIGDFRFDPRTNSGVLKYGGKESKIRYIKSDQEGVHATIGTNYVIFRELRDEGSDEGDVADGKEQKNDRGHAR